MSPVPFVHIRKDKKGFILPWIMRCDICVPVSQPSYGGNVKRCRTQKGALDAGLKHLARHQRENRVRKLLEQ